MTCPIHISLTNYSHDGSQFAAKTNLNLKEGDIVSFKYTQTVKRDGCIVPLSPTIYKVREDLTWDDVVKTHQSNTKKRVIQLLNKHTYISKGYWSEAGHCKKFFDDFAKTNQFDPTIVDNWYSVRASDIRNTQVMFVY